MIYAAVPYIFGLGFLEGTCSNCLASTIWHKESPDNPQFRLLWSLFEGGCCTGSLNPTSNILALDVDELGRRRGVAQKREKRGPFLGMYTYTE